MTAYMNQRQKVYYQLVYGDKDTFFLGFEIMHENYTFTPFPLFLLGLMADEIPGEKAGPDDEYRGFIFLQCDSNGRPFAAHLAVGRRRTLDSLEKGIRPFSTVRIFDGNYGHYVVRKWYRTFVLDAGEDNRQYIKAEDVLGPFEKRLIASYKEAKEMKNAMDKLDV